MRVGRPCATCVRGGVTPMIQLHGNARRSPRDLAASVLRLPLRRSGRSPTEGSAIDHGAYLITYPARFFVHSSERGL